MEKPVLKDDNSGFGDSIACCPLCGKPIYIPMFSEIEIYKCSCGAKINLKIFDNLKNL